MDQILLRKDRKKHTPLENHAAMNTPRTDLETQLTVISCEDSCIETYIYREGNLYSGDIVTADFARQLETELQTMTTLADRLAEAISQSPYDEPLAKALDDYENHKT